VQGGRGNKTIQQRHQTTPHRGEGGGFQPQPKKTGEKSIRGFKKKWEQKGRRARQNKAFKGIKKAEITKWGANKGWAPHASGGSGFKEMSKKEESKMQERHQKGQPGQGKSKVKKKFKEKGKGDPSRGQTKKLPGMIVTASTRQVCQRKTPRPPRGSMPSQGSTPPRKIKRSKKRVNKSELNRGCQSERK